MKTHDRQTIVTLEDYELLIGTKTIDKIKKRPNGSSWRVIQGSPDFFSITKKMHNALQGSKINLTRMKKDIYERVIFEHSMRIPRL